MANNALSHSASESRLRVAPVAGPSVVVIGMIDGSVRRGLVRAFQPMSADIEIELEHQGRKAIPAERAAYVAFVQQPREPRPTLSGPLERMKIHVAGGASFSVETPTPNLRNPLGFTGYPTDAQSPYRQIYFYAHGVNAKEKDVPLGEMMIDAGLLGPEHLRAGVETQQRNRSIPIGQILVEQGVDSVSVEEAAKLQARKKLRIGQILVEAGLATPDAIDRALAEQKLRKGKRLGEVLVDMGVVSEADLTRLLGQKFEIAVIDLERFAIDPAATNLVQRDLVERYGILPVRATASTLTVAISDPLALDALDAFRFQVKRRIDEVLVTPTQLRHYVDRYLAASADGGGPQFDDLLRDLRAEETGAEIQEEEGGPDLAIKDASDADGGIVRLVNQVILDAVRRGASDIHIEPNGKESSVAIRFRVDGDCIPYQELPAAYRHQIIARIKIMGGLDISERRKPQDGKIRFRAGERITELRVATLPTVNGNEDAVLRILASAKPQPLDKMGLSAWNLTELQRISKQPYGLILCVGPTGSGKTTTLHSVLSALNTADMKIWTAEDPVEITQAGLRQVQVNAKVGLTFASCMRSFLRADPDVIMVGEMRDHETASTAVEASLTGHLVLSTLHTNSAPETVTRLLDMGLDPFSFADSLLGVLAQRLARALCRRCRAKVPGTEAEFEELLRAYDEPTLESKFGVTRNDFKVWRATGCDVCSGSGYKGRTALHELLVTDDALKREIGQRASVDKIRQTAISLGMATLLQDGVAKAIAGQTDMKQVLAVCSK